MKYKFTSFFKLLIVAVGISITSIAGYAQTQALYFAFSARLNDAWCQIDSIKVHNMTQGFSTLIFYPDTVFNVDAILGVDDYNSPNLSIVAKPNPFYNKTSVDLNVVEDGDVNLNIYNITGNTVASYKNSLMLGKHQFDITLGQRGAYLLVANTPSNTVSTKMINIGDDNYKTASIEHTSFNPIDFNFTKSVASETEGDFPYTFGDMLVFTVFVTAESQVLKDSIFLSPTTSLYYTFDFYATLSLKGVAHCVNNISCNGLSDGSAAVSGVDGVPPYTYEWYNVSAPGAVISTNSVVTGLAIGTYVAKVYDANNNFAYSNQVVISQPETLYAYAVLNNNVSCNGGSNGSASVVVSGGTQPYSYLWSPTGGTYNVSSSLSAGYYIVYVTDANGCSTIATITITEPVTPIDISLEVLTNVTCNGGNDGSALATVSGGTPPYSYYWTPSGNTNALALDLTAGQHTVIVTDGAMCVTTANVGISQPATAVTAALHIINNVSCFGGNNGSAEVFASGGIPPYTYFWKSTGETTSLAVNLPAGEDTVTVTDAHGCTFSTLYNITQPESYINVSVAFINPVSCYGGNNGSAGLDIIGGVPPYSVVWSPDGLTSLYETNLRATEYMVVATDANLCTDTIYFNVPQPEAELTAVPNIISNVTCYGEDNGVAEIIVAGGTPPYSYLWIPNVSEDFDADNLAAGQYIVTVTDANFCTTETSFAITTPETSLDINAYLISNVSCYGFADGAAYVVAAGGTPPCTYSWSQLGLSDTLAENIPAGDYTIYVTDANACVDSAMITVAQPEAPITLNPIINNIGCYGENNGSITLNVVGGTSPYSYLWSDGSTASSLSDLSQGVYSLSVSDAHNCSVDTSFTITQPATALTTEAVLLNNVYCTGIATGSAIAVTNGGVPPYSYLWMPSGETTATAVALSEGVHIVTVTDANLCVVSSQITVTQPATAVSAYYTVYDNVSCYGGNDGAAAVFVSGGTPPYNYSWMPNGGTTAAVAGLTAGIYTVTIIDANLCTTEVTLEITQPTEGLTASANVVNHVSCFGGSNGFVTVNVNGGTPPYSYNWSPNTSNLPSATNLSAGTYTVTVTDANYCTVTVSAVITQPSSPLHVYASVVNPVTCYGGDDGSVTATVNGGTAPYFYVWAPTGGNQPTASNLETGTYHVLVTDANGCTTTSNSVFVRQPVVNISAYAYVTDMTCGSSTKGKLSVVVSNSVSPCTYLWYNELGTVISVDQTVECVPSGTYYVIVTDANGCVAESNQVVAEY